MSRVILPAKLLGETKLYNQFDFTSLLAVGETILTQVVTATVYSGTDANPQNIIDGATSVNGAVISQLITGGVLGVIYELLCKVTTIQGQTLELSGYLAVIQDLP